MRIPIILKCFLLSLSISGCVTTYENSGRVIDKASAIDANINLGMTYLRRGSKEPASRAFLTALKIDSNTAEAHQGMALVHQLNGEYDLAEKRFKRALKGKAYFSMAGVQMAYARFLLDQNRPEEAKPLFEQVSQDIAYRGRAEALYYLGLTKMQLGDKPGAKIAYAHGLKLNERFAPPALELADLYFHEGNYALSKKHLDQYIATSNQSPRSLWLGIRIERIFGNQDRVASYALALKNMHPYSKEYLEYKKLNSSN